ncbi:hypothetical protein [Actinorugispora endophytica]|uniref:Uncharacterized protein n=1 Tax=Actinorugispora endophytica TaxID=1605990 RepID=A0A4R6UQG3_9ACTN|nr:hypothetical protein [Actinorugispora endophytica]TDQ49271.1 hypothetical protein EV190_11667 [Actinorugispora endophytica]
MRLTLLAKDDKSGEKGCPSVYLADTGELVVQGVELAAPDLAELQNPLPGETAVRIAPEVALRAVELYDQNRAR